MDRAAKVQVSQVDLDWQHKCELFLAPWPMIPQAFKEGMQHTDGLVIKEWT